MNEDDVVEVVDRVEIEQERRISVLLQNAGCRECRLETVSSAPPAACRKLLSVTPPGGGSVLYRSRFR